MGKKGFVHLSKENGMDLISRCRHVINTTVLREKVEFKEFSLRKFRMVTRSYYKSPFWWQYKESLVKHLNDLEGMLARPDPIYLSLLCYEHLIKMSRGDDAANPIFIMDY